MKTSWNVSFSIWKSQAACFLPPDSYYVPFIFFSWWVAKNYPWMARFLSTHECICKRRYAKTKYILPAWFHGLFTRRVFPNKDQVMKSRKKCPPALPVWARGMLCCRVPPFFLIFFLDIRTFSLS